MALSVWWLPGAPLQLAALAAPKAGEVAGFERPDRGESTLGLDLAWEVTCHSADPLREAALAIGELREQVQVKGEGARFGGAVLLGTAAFDPLRTPGLDWDGFAYTRFILPRVCFLVRGSERVCAVAGAASRDEAMRWRDDALAQLCVRGTNPQTPGQGFQVELEETSRHFRGRVTEALSVISRGDLQKIVLARACRVTASRPLDVETLLRTLRAREESCAHFAFRRAGSWWLGATPENLVRVDGERVQADALAGSMPRGSTPQEDAVQQRQLRESKKEQEEHEWVRSSVRAALEPCVDGLAEPEAPVVLSTGNLHHLHTPLRGRRQPGIDALELAARLHPTPAVAGVPTKTALAWLRDREPLGRGCYAGPVGWLRLDGEGDLAVALRCALIDGGSARCFAGAGIVASSDPDAEFEETRVKLDAMLACLQEAC